LLHLNNQRKKHLKAVWAISNEFIWKPLRELARYG
jgi:hypothetical protein